MIYHSLRRILCISKSGFGFSLIELMVTVTIIGILLVVGVPSFVRFIGSQGVKTATYDLMADLYFARSEAIKRNSTIDVQATTCQAWQGGWTVRLGSTILRTHDSMSGLNITDSVNSSTNCKLSYNKAGRLASSSMTFTIDVSPSSSKVTPRCINIDLSGRANSKLRSGSTCS